MDFSSEIIFEDNHLLLVHKMANMPTQADISDDPDLLSSLKAFLKERDQKSGNVYLGLIHRLDRPVSGLILFAKTSKAASRLSEQIRKKEFKKTYLALVEGIPKEAEKRLIHHLVKDNRRNKVTAFKDEQKSSKKAILDYNVEKELDGKAVLKIDLLTGRSHQIRCQLSSIGYPIIGDLKYGFKGNSKWNIREKGIALFSHEISFLHPVKKTTCSFKRNPDWMY